MARFLRILSIAMITAGIVILADVAITLAWKEPISSLYGQIQQNRLAGELDRLEAEFPDEATLAQVAEAKGVPRKAHLLANAFETEVAINDAIGRIHIPSIGADYLLVEGTDSANLQRGPGHYPATQYPGQGATIGIAGHRTTYLAPFRHIDDLEQGDDVILEMPYATFTYEVERKDVVDPGDVNIVRRVDYERLVLTACHPLYSAAQRYVVFARLSDVSLFAASGRRWRDP